MSLYVSATKYLLSLSIAIISILMFICYPVHDLKLNHSRHAYTCIAKQSRLLKRFVVNILIENVVTSQLSCNINNILV